MQENFSDLPISINPQVLGGIPVFRGTRVPVSTLFSYLEKDYSLEEFLDCFPSVSREAAIVVLTQAERFSLKTQVREIISDVEIMGGTPVFAGTRVPFDGLIEYIEAGETIDDFVRDFPTVTREQVARALEEAALCTEELVSENFSPV